MIETKVVSGRIAFSSCVRINQPLGRNIQPGDCETFLLLEMLEGVQNRMVLGPVADQMLSVRRDGAGRARAARGCSIPCRRS